MYSKKIKSPPPSVVRWLVLYVLLNMLNTMFRVAIPNMHTIAQIDFYLYWKLPIFDVLYLLQLKFFIISYVFNLEQRKYVAVWFFISNKEFNVYQQDIHIFMNMIIWPLMTYTVTSFGKAFAHLRNCLLKKSTCYK